MSPETKPELSLQDREALRSTASWLNAELEGGACVWRFNIINAIRQFPNPIIFDLDDTLVYRDLSGEKVNPQAQEALERAEKVGSIFIVTNGLISVAGLKQLGLWRNGLVLINRKNYASSPWEDTPFLATAVAQTYIAKQQSLGIQYRENDFDFKDSAKKHLAPLFMKSYQIPLVDNSFSATLRNPGIWGLTLHDQQFYEYQQEVARETGVEVIPDLLEAITRIENYYSLLYPMPEFIRSTLVVESSKEVALTPTARFQKISSSIKDLLPPHKMLEGYQILTGLRYPAKIFYEAGWMTWRVEFSSRERLWIIRQHFSTNHVYGGVDYGSGFDYLQYSKRVADQIIEYGDFNLGEAERLTRQMHPHMQLVNVFEKFEELLAELAT